MKFAIIGGGSSYTPELLGGLFERMDRIPVSEVWIMDLDAERLTINADFARRMAGRHGQPFTIHQTTDMREAVTGAKYVVTQIRVGGMQARIGDEKLGLRHNIIGQETTGIGGFACALRTIPRILDVAHAMEELSPDGYLLNFTNPAGINTEAVIRHSKIKSVGMCNIPINLIMDLRKKFGGEVENIALDYVGLNHLAWCRGFTVDGKDISDAAIQHFIDTAEDEWGPATAPAMKAAMTSMHMWCNPYLQYFYSPDTMLESLKKKDKTRGEEVVEVEKTLFEKYKDPNLTEKPEELMKRGGAHYSTAAFHLVDAIENDLNARQVVCCRNNGAIPTFDDDCAVEVSALIGKDGAKAIPQEKPAPIIRGLMQEVKAYESMTVQAAVTGDRNTAYQALLLNPLMPNAVECEAVLSDVLETNKQFLQGTFF